MSAARNLRLFALYLACSLEGFTHGVYLVWLTSHRGFSPFAVSLVLAGGDLALLVLEVPTGIFADRLGARRSLVLGSVVQLVGLALFWWAGGIVWLALGSFAIALGDAFRHGADEALLFRSCAAVGEVGSFGRRIARAQAWSLAALVALIAAGGFVAERISYDVAWAIELALSFAGLVLALAMVEPPPTGPLALDPDAPDTPANDVPTLATAWRRVPWALVVPASIASGFANAGEFLTQTSPPAGVALSTVSLAIAGAMLFEAIGAWAVGRGFVPSTERALDGLGITALAAAVSCAITPFALLPALSLMFLCDGAAHALRSALVQARASDGERATLSSAATAMDMLAKTASLPAAAWLFAHGDRRSAVLALVAASVVGWALAKLGRTRPARSGAA